MRGAAGCCRQRGLSWLFDCLQCSGHAVSQRYCIHRLFPVCSHTPTFSAAVPSHPLPIPLCCCALPTTLPPRRRFASCGGDRQVFLWDVATGNIIRKFRGHDAYINTVWGHSGLNIGVGDLQWFGGATRGSSAASRRAPLSHPPPPALLHQLRCALGSGSLA